jgi:hypothetical protein
MDSINRSVAILKPKQPLIDWLNTLPDTDSPFSLSELQSDCTVLLLPEDDYDHQAIKYIKKIYKDVFEIELDGYCTDPSYWPSKRDFKTFTQWFDIELHSEVFDTVNKAIIKERLE